MLTRARVICSHCAACRRIRDWEATRRRILERMTQSGEAVWVGAWSVRPENYIGYLGPGTIEDYIPLKDPRYNTEPRWRPAAAGQ